MMKEKIILSLDTASNEYVIVVLKIGDKEFSKKELYGKTRSQIVLPLLQRLLDEHSLTIHNLDTIEVNTGPGSFTGLRVGVSIANSLGYYLKIPINNNPTGQLVEPEYT